MNEAVLNVLHRIIDALGGGHQHLHDAVDAAAAPAPDNSPAGDDEATGSA